MEGQERLIYLWDGTEWVKAVCNAAGQLEVEAPATDTLLAGGLPATLDAGALRVREQTNPLPVSLIPAAVTTTKMVGAGQVAAGAHRLYWISCNPSAGNSQWGLSDAIIALQPILLEHFHTTRESHNTNLLPPMQFDTGIYLETFVAMTSMTFGYV